jgi:hypothetical protein
MRKPLLSIKTALLVAFMAAGAISAQAQCTYTLNLVDSWGDGWDGATMAVSVAGTPIAGSPFTVAAAASTFTFPVTSGQEVILTYSAGSYEAEHSWDLQAEGPTTIFSDGPSPATGAAATFTSITDDPTLLMEAVRLT